MYLHLVIERAGGWSWKPSIHKSTISTRVMWGYFAIAKIHVNEYEYATASYDWVVPKDWRVPPAFEAEKFRRVPTRRGITRA